MLCSDHDEPYMDILLIVGTGIFSLWVKCFYVPCSGAARYHLLCCHQSQQSCEDFSWHAWAPGGIKLSSLLLQVRQFSQWTFCWLPQLSFCVFWISNLWPVMFHLLKEENYLCIFLTDLNKFCNLFYSRLHNKIRGLFTSKCRLLRLAT